MKIIELLVENVKKLRAVEIRPTSDLVLVTGANGSGKSSVLDSIWWALGGKGNIQAQPIREGENKARIRLNLGELIVERKFTPAGTTLVVSDERGLVHKSPQSILDALVGELTFDPLEFARATPKCQFDLIRKVAKVDLDFEALAAKDQYDYDARRGLKRSLTDCEAALSTISVPKDAPAEPVDTKALMQKLAEANAANQQATTAEYVRAQQDKQITSLKEEINRLRAKLDNLVEERNASSPPPPKIDTAPIEAMIANSKKLNEAYAARKLRKQAEDRKKVLETEIDAHTRAIALREKQREKAIREAAMPVPNMTLAAGQVLFNGVPFEQASSAEQLRTSVAVAMAANPKLRVIRVKDGSLLDEAGMAILAEMTRGGDYQVWCEKVDSSGTVGIYLEDGEVVAANP